MPTARSSFNRRVGGAAVVSTSLSPGENDVSFLSCRSDSASPSIATAAAITTSALGRSGSELPPRRVPGATLLAPRDINTQGGPKPPSGCRPTRPSGRPTLHFHAPPRGVTYGAYKFPCNQFADGETFAPNLVDQLLAAGIRVSNLPKEFSTPSRTLTTRLLHGVWRRVLERYPGYVLHPDTPAQAYSKHPPRRDHKTFHDPVIEGGFERWMYSCVCSYDLSGEPFAHFVAVMYLERLAILGAARRSSMQRSPPLRRNRSESTEVLTNEEGAATNSTTTSASPLRQALFDPLALGLQGSRTHGVPVDALTLHPGFQLSTFHALFNLAHVAHGDVAFNFKWALASFIPTWCVSAVTANQLHFTPMDVEAFGSRQWNISAALDFKLMVNARDALEFGHRYLSVDELAYFMLILQPP